MKTSSLLPSYLFVLLLVWEVASRISNKIIRTKSGPVRGTEVFHDGNKVYQYLGIPFARPPVGQLRFQKPLPVEPWNETIIADKVSPACIQYMYYPVYRSPWYDHKNRKSENCLHLNIWVPDSVREDKCYPESKAVMIWFYGGFFAVGSSGILELYDGKILASEGDVIVVAPNYRVGVMGSFTSFTEAAPGNLALYDMLEAMKWVKKNIEAFGGDPNQVTLFGQSAGAIAIGMFCVSPLTAELFHRVIMESASPAYLQAEIREKNRMYSQKIAEKFGCANKTVTIYKYPDYVVNCMKKIDAHRLGFYYFIMSTQKGQEMIPSWGDEMMPRVARKELIKGHIRKVDVLIGSNRDEGAYLICSANPEQFGYRGHKKSKINPSDGKVILEKTFFGPIPALEHSFAEFLKYNNRTTTELYELAGDVGLTCPTVYFAESASRVGNKVFYYYFTHRAKRTSWAQWMGVTHGEEIPFVFGKPLENHLRYTPEEIKLSREMIKIWTDFAKYGKPGDIDWPLYTKENPQYVELNTEKTVKKGFGPHSLGCNFLRPFFGFL